MALFVEELGVTVAVPFYAGIAVASPLLWPLRSCLPSGGALADRYGRNPWCLELPIAMTLTMGGMPLSHPSFGSWFCAFSMVSFSGFVPNSTALIASQVPKDQSGYALGDFVDLVLWLAPWWALWLGDWLLKIWECAMSFSWSASSYFWSLLDLLGHWGRLWAPSKRRTQIQLGVAHVHSAKGYPLGPLLTSMTIQMIAQSISPILPLYVSELWGQRDNLIFCIRDDCFSYGSLSSMLLQDGWENSETKSGIIGSY